MPASRTTSAAWAARHWAQRELLQARRSTDMSPATMLARRAPKKWRSARCAHTHTYRPHARLALCMSSDNGSGHAMGMFMGSSTLPRPFQARCLAAQVYPNAMAVVVSTENITQNIYLGNQRSFTIPGCIFRIGGAAVMLSNRPRDAWRAKCAHHYCRASCAVQFRPLTPHDF